MAKRKRQPFPTTEKQESGSRNSGNRSNQERAPYYNHHAPGGLFAFFRDFGVRETIESVIVAVVLALMFRAYEAEAFIIPTGSMAPTLQGQHTDFDCPKCGLNYQSGASYESTTFAPTQRDFLRATYCPICQYRTKLSRRKNVDHNSNQGDRILVNKFVYDFKDPERWDVIVFKNPNNGKQNYIKRLVGLPNENLLIENGDIISMEEGSPGVWSKKIIRKPPDKMAAMLQLVDDTDHIADELKDAQWPSRWQQWSGETDGWQLQTSADKASFSVSGSERENWLRYRHLIPSPGDWPTIEAGNTPNRMQGENVPKGRLISDYYCYNHREYNRASNNFIDHSIAAHWVGDLAFEATVEIKSSAGEMILDLVEGGAHYSCVIDVATGKATLASSDSTVKFLTADDQEVASPSAQTTIRGTGSHVIQYANCDDRLFLWIDRKPVEFDAPFFVRTSSVFPTYSAADPADAEPLGIGSRNLDLKIDRLRVLRDVYYTSPADFNMRQANTDNETRIPKETINRIHGSPEQWTSADAKRLFSARKNLKTPMYPLDENQFLPMGDNSPASLDGRVWGGEKYVDGDMLIGRALFIYWPHSLNKPVKYFPNFKKMKFIK